MYNNFIQNSSSCHRKRKRRLPNKRLFYQLAPISLLRLFFGGYQTSSLCWQEMLG
uniref:Uncharacterized protein n=1 Tax=Lotus japonicus TaxID=34305 RepID=I3S2F1_LOTJA|nr:unknown [Lotus japonicus]